MMAQEEVKKSKKDIEIDTDDVKQEDLTVEVKESANNVEKKEDPKLNFGEVDLGYTDHETSQDDSDKKEEKTEIKIAEDKVEDVKEQLKTEGKEIETEKKEDKEFSEKDFDSLYKKYKQQNRRIDKLTFRREEAERQAKAAEQVAAGMKKRLDDIEKRYNVESDNYLKEFEARVDAQREQVKNNLKLAIENNDTNAIMEANDQLTQLAVQKEKAKIRAEERKAAIEQAEAKKKEDEEKAKQAPAQENQEQPTPSEKAMDFREKHKKWFGYDKDPALTAYAVALDGQIRQEGIEVDSDEYYNEIEKRLDPILTAQGLKEPAETVEAKQKAKPVQTVASAGRKEVGRKTVTLTKSQVAIAKRLGVPLEEYVKYVKEAQ